MSNLSGHIKPVYWADRQGNTTPSPEEMERYLDPALGNELGRDLLNKPEYVLCLDASGIRDLVPVELLALGVDAKQQVSCSLLSACCVKSSDIVLALGK